MELNDLNLRNPIRIGYYNPFNAFASVRDDFEGQFPLTNLHWKYHPLKPVKLIPLLPVQLVEEIPKTGRKPENEGVYLRLMFIRVASLDEYRSKVRPLIKAWLSSMVRNTNIEWMIVLLIPEGIKDKQSTLIKTSAFDKLKIDFGIDGKELEFDVDDELDHCFKLKEKYPDDLQKLEAYNELVAAIKLLLLRSFNRQYHHLNEQLVSMPELTMAKFRVRLRLAGLHNDLRLLQDSLDEFKALATDLNELSSEFSSDAITLPSSLEDYVFEHAYDTHELRRKFETGSVSLAEAKILIFVNQLTLLQSLANFATSISISSIYISSLLHTVLVFLNDLQSRHHGLEEWMYVILDNYLNLPICEKLIEINKKQPGSLELEEIYEFKAELRLMQRSLLVKLASQKGYSLTGVLQEVSLDEPAKVTHSALIEVLSSEESATTFFEGLTQIIIQDLVRAGRSKTIDILTVDLAFINYKRGKYSETLGILQNSYEFFIENGWKYMGGTLLEIYLDCIEHVDHDKEHVLQTCMKLFANFDRTGSLEKARAMYDKIVQHSLESGSRYVFPVTVFFDFEVVPYIHASEGSDRTVMEVVVNNSFGIDFDIEHAALKLTNDKETVAFTADKVRISPKSGSLQLFSQETIVDDFHPVSLELIINKGLTLFQDIDPPEADRANDTVIQNHLVLTESVAPKPAARLVMKQYQRKHQFHGEFANPSTLRLGRAQVDLALTAGQSDATNVRVRVFLPLEKVHLPKTEFTIEQLSPSQTHVFSVQHSAEKVVELGAEVTYVLNGRQHRLKFSQKIDTTLTVLVTVQDIFRVDSVFSKFLVGTSNPRSPVRILGTDLSSTDNYTIEKPPACPPLVAYGEQPASFFFKISPHKDYTVDSDDTLDLTVEYSNLHDECVTEADKAVWAQLEAQSLSHYYFLVRDVLQALTFDLNHYLVYREVKVTNMEEAVGLVEAVCPHIQAKDQKKVLDIVKSLKIGTPQVVKRTLQISVPVPVLSMLQSVEFTYDPRHLYLVGEPIAMKLHISSLQRWNVGQANVLVLAESSPTKHLEAPLHEYQVTIVSDDNWLLSGPKRQTFDVDESTSSHHDLDVVLVPLNVGRLALPRVTIKPLHERTDFSLDTITVNGLDTLLVVPELDSITFSF